MNEAQKRRNMAVELGILVATRDQAPNKYGDLAIEYLRKHEIELRTNSVCWSRPHAHVKGRIICKMALPRGRVSFFHFLHEVGHIAHPKGGVGYRAQEEYWATEYAKDEMRKCGISVPRKTLAEYSDYIQRTLDRGIRRGLKSVPEELSAYANKSNAHKHNWQPTGSGYSCSVCAAWKSGNLHTLSRDGAP